MSKHQHNAQNVVANDEQAPLVAVLPAVNALEVPHPAKSNSTLVTLVALIEDSLRIPQAGGDFRQLVQTVQGNEVKAWYLHEGYTAEHFTGMVTKTPKYEQVMLNRNNYLLGRMVALCDRWNTAEYAETFNALPWNDNVSKNGAIEGQKCSVGPFDYTRSFEPDFVIGAKPSMQLRTFFAGALAWLVAEPATAEVAILGPAPGKAIQDRMNVLNRAKAVEAKRIAELPKAPDSAGTAEGREAVETPIEVTGLALEVFNAIDSLKRAFVEYTSTFDIREDDEDILKLASYCKLEAKILLDEIADSKE